MKLLTEEEKAEIRHSSRHLKGWRLLVSIPFLLLSLVMMGAVWLFLRATYFVAFTTVQVQGFDGEENKRFQRFAAWVKGDCYDCQQMRKIDDLMDDTDRKVDELLSDDDET